MTYKNMLFAEKQTKRFFKNKYGLFWKRKVNPKRLDWILCDEYYNKFKEMLELREKMREKK